jgi:hypothetical protein
MSFVTALSLVMSLAGAAERGMPADFLEVESKAWGKWLDEPIQVSWTKIPLKSVLANEFGPAAFTVDGPKALDTPITFDAANLTRRVALWRLSQRYSFTIRWAQKGEPKVFLGLSEVEKRKQTVGGVTLTAVTQVMRADYAAYQKLKLAGQVTKEQVIDGVLYYAIDVDRDLHFDHTAAHVNEVQRFKTAMPPVKARLEVRFTAKVNWIETIGKRDAEAIPIGADVRWLIGIDVLSVEKAGGQFGKKGPLILAVHSPVKVFREDRENVPGKVYEFRISGFMSDGRPTYSMAEAQEEKKAKKE